MKLTAKNYLETYENYNAANREARKQQENNNIEEYRNLKNEAEKLKTIIDSFPTVNVSFYIGYRAYYENVVKIGKFYFDNGRKMTQSRGYRSIKEIAEITERMQKAMYEDTMYY